MSSAITDATCNGFHAVMLSQVCWGVCTSAVAGYNPLTLMHDWLEAETQHGRVPGLNFHGPKTGRADKILTENGPGLKSHGPSRAVIFRPVQGSNV